MKQTREKRTSGSPVTAANSSGRRQVLDLQQAGAFRKLREAARLPRQVVAASLGIEETRLSALETGSVEPELEEALALSQLYLSSLNRLNPVRLGASRTICRSAVSASDRDVARADARGDSR